VFQIFVNCYDQKKNMQRKNITVVHIFLTLNMGGMESVGVNLILGLQKKNVKNHVICLDEKGIFAEQLEQAGVSVWCANRINKSKVSLLRELASYIRCLEVDIVHTHNPAPNLWGGMAAFLAGVPLRISTHHGINKAQLASKKRRWLSCIASLFCHQTVTVSKALEIQLKKESFGSAASISTIYNGVDISFFDPKIDGRLNRNDFGIDAEERVIGSVARFSDDKDYITLISAFDVLRSKGIAGKLLLIGDGETRSHIEQQAKGLKFSSDIIFLGQRTDIIDLLSLFDIYVLSTHTEGVSISLLEAMAMQLPVVATAVGGNVEVIESNISGLLSNASDVNSLTDHLMTLCTDKQKVNQISLAARHRVESIFSLDAMVKSYYHLYTQQNVETTQ